MRWSLLLSALGLVLSASSAHALDYAEHCRISNRAFRMAASRAARGADPARVVQLRDLSDSTRKAVCLEKAVDASTGQRPPSHAYGEWVALVDWARSPADFFLTPFDTLATRTNSIPANGMARLADLSLQDLVVLHDNAEHFAGHALYSYRLWHQRALDEAARSNLGVALVFNAFADHYLEDLHAPGHIFTPRSGLNDVLSGGMHNHYNRRGAYFFPRNMALLVDYLDDPASTRDSLAPGWESLVAKACRETPAHECILEMEGDSIEMFGDHHTVRSARQEIFLTLLVARSIEDVLRAYAGGPSPGPRDHFEDVRWCGYRRRPAEGSVWEWTSPTAQTPFGQMRQEDGAGLPNYQPWPYLRGGFATDLRGGGFLEVSHEWIQKASAAGWLAPAEAGDASQDESTYWGVDARLPLPWEPDRSAVGVYVRPGTSYNRINLRLTKVAGMRVQPFRTAVEPHVGLSGEIGFGLLHVELRPSVQWNSRDGFTMTVFSGITGFIANKNEKLPRAPEPIPRTPRGTVPCAEDSPNSITMP